MAEDFFGNLSKTLKKTVDTVGKKTDEFVEIQKIRTRQHALEDQIEKNYQDIGQIIYNRYLNGEAFDENLAGICKDITDLEKEIADCREDVANKRGRIVCPACGASVPKDAAFCMRCGAAMPEKEEEPEDAEFVHVEPEEKAEETEAAAPEEEPEEENSAQFDLNDTMIWTLLPGAVFLADGCLKKKAEEELKENEQIPVCKGHIVLRKCHNRGVAGGGFADSTKKVEILTFFLLSGLWARLGALAGRRKCKAKKLGLALTIGGGMSNWYDRHKRGYVTDYVSFRFGPEKFRRLVFNVSDFCIFFGIALLTAISCRESR